MKVTPILLLVLAACSGADDAPQVDSPANFPPESFWSATPPETVLGVTEGAVRSASGDEVALRGTLADMVPGLSAFTLVEEALDHCAEMGEPDHCATPWDYCCADPAAVRAGKVTVELRDPAGNPGSWRIQGFHSLDHLSEIIVAGTIEKDSQGNTILVAKSISPAL